MHTIRSKDGTLIAYQRSGEGPPLVLVHGAVADHTRWTPVLPFFEAHFTVCALARRGRSESGDNPVYAIEREFEDIAALVDAIASQKDSEERVDLLGHSFGAFCSLEAARLTAHLRRLILYEPPTPGLKDTLPPPIAGRLQAYLAAGQREAVISTFLLEIAGLSQEELDMLRSLPSWQGRIDAAHTILREINSLEEYGLFNPGRYQGVTVPTLLLVGGDSRAGYHAFIRELHAILPDSRVAVLPGQQHVAMNTAPEMFAGEVLAFLLQSD